MQISGTVACAFGVDCYKGGLSVVQAVISDV